MSPRTASDTRAVRTIQLRHRVSQSATVGGLVESARRRGWAKAAGAVPRSASVRQLGQCRHCCHRDSGHALQLSPMATCGGAAQLHTARVRRRCSNGHCPRVAVMLNCTLHLFPTTAHCACVRQLLKCSQHVCPSNAQLHTARVPDSCSTAYHCTYFRQPLTALVTKD